MFERVYRSRETIHVAARWLALRVGDQDKAAPKKVDDLFKEVKDGNPSYTDEQAWATAWSIYCKHVDPNGEHCQKGGPSQYLKEGVSVPDQHQLKILKDTVRNPAKSFLGGPSAKEAEEILKKKFHFTDAQIQKLKKGAEQGSIERPTPSAAEQAPDTGTWEPYEKHGEWNLLIYHPGGRRNLSYFLKNPSGGGGGSNDGTSVPALVKQVIRSTGWSSPHINPHKKDKVWVSVLQFDGENWGPVKQWWETVPPELLSKTVKPLTQQEHFELLTK